VNDAVAKPDLPPLGLIAGEGIFPVLVARGARAAGRRIACASLGGFAADEVASLADVHQTVGLMRLNQWIRVLRRAGVREAIMVGRVPKQTLYQRGRIGRWLQFVPDWRTIGLYVRRLRHDKRDHAVLNAVADELLSAGITLIDSTTYVTDQLATLGVMTRRQPTDRQWADIRFGYPLCRQLGQLDVGQALAIVDKDVIAVEAIEGTNAMIERAGQYCRTSGWVLIKTANVNADMRFDVPSVGTTTIQKLHAARGGVLVLQAQRTILLEKPTVLELADRLGIAVVGVDDATMPATPGSADAGQGRST
jgi:DUF1009 family protein